MEEVMEQASLAADYPLDLLPAEKVYPIFRVPSPLRSITPSMYIPEVVALGPLHHPDWKPLIKADHPDWNPLINADHPALREMEGFKLLALQKMAPDVNYRELVSYVKQDEQEMLNECYGGLLSKEYGDALVSSKFAHTIATDACFIVAVLHSLFQANRSFMETKINVKDIGVLDEQRTSAHFFSIYTKTLPRPMQKAIWQDLLLVENQVPLLALKHVIRMESRCASWEQVERVLELYVAALTHMVSPFSRGVKRVFARVKGSGTQAKHLLGMMYNIIVNEGDMSSIKIDDPKPSRDPHVKNMHDARYIHMFGVVIEGHGCAVNEITFNKGKLSIPKIHVDDDTEHFLRNLLAYESCYMIDRLDVLSYVHFMDFLIDKPEDVELLVECKVITEASGSKQKVTAMWNSLCGNTMCVFSDKYLDIAQKLNERCSNRWRRLWVEFYRSKLAKPWLLASLISAAALLVMTFLILWYTILIYAKGG